MLGITSFSINNRHVTIDQCGYQWQIALDGYYLVTATSEWAVLFTLDKDRKDELEKLELTEMFGKI